MRDNENRFAAPDDGAAVQQTSPQLNFTTPTEIVELPSKGEFYPLGHPLHGKDTLEIRFMTAKEEDILTSKALIKKGVAIDRMLQNLIVEKGVKVEDLLLGDKNALTVAARVSGYGADYTVQVTCPECDAKTKHVFDLADLRHKEAQELSHLGVEKTQNGTFLLELLKTGAKVEFRLLTGKDEQQMIEQLSKSSKEEANATSQLKRVIVSVNGNGDKAVINSFVDSMPVVDAKLLRGVVRDLTPDMDMRQDFSCPSCGFDETMEVPFTVEFFWPK